MWQMVRDDTVRDTLCYKLIRLDHSISINTKPFGNTVKPPKSGHFGDGPFVPCREVVHFSEVLF